MPTKQLEATSARIRMGLESNIIYNEDCLTGMDRLPDNSVDLIATDPPYFRVKGESWDRQWESSTKFIEWIGELCKQWKRVLKLNGSLYCFASPQMADRVSVAMRADFNVLNHVIWLKPQSNTVRRHLAQVLDKGLCRSWLPSNERIIFAEHYSADNIAPGEAKQGESRGFLFAPLRDWFIDAWVRSGVSRKTIDQVCGTSNVSQYWFLERDYQLPTSQRYAILRSIAPSAFDRDYEELRREYEELRRPFAVTADVPFTDVWAFPTVYKGSHPCEKPLALMEHIVTASSRPGGVVLDCFIGSATTAISCLNTGRDYIGFENNPAYYKRAEKRVANHPKSLLGQTA